MIRRAALFLAILIFAATFDAGLINLAAILGGAGGAADQAALSGTGRLAVGAVFVDAIAITDVRWVLRQLDRISGDPRRRTGPRYEQP